MVGMADHNLSRFNLLADRQSGRIGEGSIDKGTEDE